MTDPSRLPCDWASRDFLALDFETTGLDSRRERIVEVGAIRFRPGPSGQGGELASLVDPDMPMPRIAQSIHGISDQDLAGAPSFATLAPALLALAKGATIIAHNAPFDLAFLREELARAGMSSLFGSPEVLDTRLLAKAAYPERRSYRLVDLATSFKLHAGSAHRALDDARTCRDLFLLCARRLDEKGEAHARR